MSDPDFQADPERPNLAPPEGALLLDLDGYEGPLDILLTLARQQKVDLRRISILALAEQYLAFIAAARKLHLEIAADYLVMAAWLAYLKSRLLIPDPEPEVDEPSGAEMADRLAFRLRRLQAMRDAAHRLFGRERIGIDLFPRGMPQGVRVVRTPYYAADLLEMLRAYGAFKGSRGPREALTMRAARQRIVSLEEAVARLRRLLGSVPEWTVLNAFLPEDLQDDLSRRSGLAAAFGASLELAKRGELELRQMQPFGPIYVKRGAREPGSDERTD